jgi:hypothetical protein
MGFYNNETPFWIQRECQATSTGKCPCGGQIRIGEPIAIIEWEGPYDNWSRMHIDCARKHVMNQENQISLDLGIDDTTYIQPFTFGTQRDMIVFQRHHPTIHIETYYDPDAKWGQQIAYRISAHQPERP